MIYSSSDYVDLSVYASKRIDGALTVIVVSLSLDEQTKTLRIADHVSVKGEALFYPAHKVVNVGDVDLTAEYPFPIHYFVCCQIEVQK